MDRDLQSHVIVLDSRYAFSGGFDYSRQYYFDWSVIPDGKYELTFSFMSDVSTTLQDQYSLFSNLISPINVYHASGFTGANTAAFLGSCRFGAFNGGGSVYNFLYTEQHSNPPVLINRPMSNLFTIGIFDGMSGLNNTNTPGYILTLYLKPLRLGVA